MKKSKTKLSVKYCYSHLDKNDSLKYTITSNYSMRFGLVLVNAMQFRKRDVETGCDNVPLQS
jgi:hypothetical protein